MTKKNKQPSKKAIIATRIIVTMLVLASAIMVFFFARSIVDKRTLIDRGEQVTGAVSAQEIDIHTARSGSMTSRTLNYAFNPEGSQEKMTNNEFNVSKKEYEEYPQGSEIPVTYLPNDPTMNAPTVSLRHMHPMSVIFIYYIGIIGACILFVRIGKLLRKKYKIKKEPGISNYFLSVGVFVVAVSTGMGITVLISKLASLFLI